MPSELRFCLLCRAGFWPAEPAPDDARDRCDACQAPVEREEAPAMPATYVIPTGSAKASRPCPRCIGGQMFPEHIYSDEPVARGTTRLKCMSCGHAVETIPTASVPTERAA